MSHKEYCDKHIGTDWSCEACRKAYRLYHREWEREKAKEPEWRKRKNERAKKHRLKYADKIKQKKKDYYKQNSYEIKKKSQCHRYGITTDEYDLMYLGQNGKCAICGNRFFRKREPCIDHDHKTGKVRAMLCIVCNTGVGYIEMPNFVARVTKYLNSIQE